ncbi:calcium-binding and coiled-coil domain-containing protein 1 isoform X4 [Girardinichthys multiradiatus]|uniref:calcium-binding and coiled-coil domain-containing protein 1 isoform X4 n=1 Tax=Girardinichthys multiradiatus TaxID=208333 RepID=UPI001FACEAD8|nr:calcium-binding and coiled-coil domain-containing protein 1 isoform X4 [Girardinichthys multiradiatus]
MDMAWQVEFRNVGCTYFPQSRVDCHYTLSSQHSWANSDWIGLFKVGWSSVKDYETFVWALAPADYQEGTEANCCVHFQASYLPKPSSQEYEFVYVDAKGEVCSRSSKFTFCAPTPLEDMVTLEEESHGEDEGTDMLLVIPRAELLQNRLQECLRERAELLREQEVANKQREREKEDHKREKQEWDRQRRGLEREVGRLKEELMQSHRKIEEMEMEQKDEQALGECLAQEKAALMDAKAAKEQLIRELEEDIKTLTQRSVERETELERMKERAKRAIALRKEEEHERKNQQNKLDQTEAELRSLFKEFQVLRNSLAQRDTSVLQLQNTITTLTQKLTTAHRKETESEVLLKEMRSLRERFHMSERTVEGLKSDLSTLAAQRDRVQAELHQTRVQAAQLTIQLADASMALREGRANWAQDRQNLQHTAELDQESLEKLNTEMQKMQERLQEEKMERVKLEVELGREKDCNRMEQKTGTVTTARWDTAPIASTGCPETALSDSEDESPEALQILHPPRSLGHYSLCEQGQPESLLLSTPPLSPRDVDRRAVVINQPAPLSLPHQANADTLPHSSDSEEESDPVQQGTKNSEEETAFLLPEYKGPFLSDLADTSLW